VNYERLSGDRLEEPSKVSVLACKQLEVFNVHASLKMDQTISFAMPTCRLGRFGGSASCWKMVRA
jgi:hypothetical protein